MYFVSEVPFAFLYFVADRITNAHAVVVAVVDCELESS